MPAPARRTTRSTDNSSADSAAEGSSADHPSADGSGKRRRTPAQIARAAARQLSEIMGVAPQSVSGLARTDDGWLVTVEVVELERIPASTSVMASYQVELDSDGELLSYHRDRRYYRNQAGDA